MIAVSDANNLPSFTARQLYEIEQSWFAADNSSFGLMQQAAWQLSQWLLRHYADAHHIVIATGSGNNGGDGWLIAHYCYLAGKSVTVVSVAEPATADSQRAYQQALQSGVQVLVGVDRLAALSSADLLVDALCGIGLDRQPTDDYMTMIDWLNAHKAPTIAVDLPSGLLADTGQVMDGVAVHAESTLCLIALKVGMVISSGIDVCGAITLFPILPIDAQIKPAARWQRKPPELSDRQHYSHKGSYGHAFIIGGASGMSGAGVLAAEAALRAGSGKVTLVGDAVAHSSMIMRCPNVMTADLDSLGMAEFARAMAADASVVAIGMGFGRDRDASVRFANVMEACVAQSVPLVIDADGLYHLESLPESTLAAVSASSVWYTPHPGEAANLLGVRVNVIEQDRCAAVRSLQARYGGVWLLKGAGSLIADAESITICGAGNPGMATAGAGDVLSGIAAGLLAQSTLSVSLADAAMLHAAAGDYAAQASGERSLLASDIIQSLPNVL